MLFMRISGTKNDLKTFQKWLDRTKKIPPYYEISVKPEMKRNPKDEKYYRLEASLLVPSDKKGVKKSCVK